jgi:hypothetical protein
MSWYTPRNTELEVAGAEAAELKTGEQEGEEKKAPEGEEHEGEAGAEVVEVTVAGAVEAKVYCGCRPVTTEAVGGLLCRLAGKACPCPLTSLLLAGSTSKACWRKKSTPMMGKSTAAKRNGQEKTCPWN